MEIRGAVLETTEASRPFRESRPITISELTLDPPGENEVLVRIEAAGVCHSDLSVVNGNRIRPVPMLLGHEAAGRVESIGSGVENLEVGNQVVAAFLPRCNQCAACQTDGIIPCSEGSRSNESGELLTGGRRLHRNGELVHHHLGVSAFATHAVIDKRSLVQVDEDVPPEVAAVLGCAVLTGGGAVLNAGRPRASQSLAVVGLGGVGVAALITALAQDGVDVVGIDNLPDKLDLAQRLGASQTMTPREATERGVHFDVVVEAAGNPRAFETAVEITAAGGRMVSVGLPAPDARSSISPLALVAQARTITGSYLGSAVPSRDIPKFVQWWREGRLPVEELISTHIGLDSINDAMDALADGTTVRQVVVF